MSFKSGLIKTAIKWTPKSLVMWVANIVLKGIAELSDFNFDIDARTAYGQVLLAGEAEPIEVWLDDFAVIGDGDSYKLVIQKAKSNRLWLDNIFARIVGKDWNIPVPAQYAAQFALVAELFSQPESPESAEIV
jgi:hypothetical protein